MAASACAKAARTAASASPSPARQSALAASKPASELAQKKAPPQAPSARSTLAHDRFASLDGGSRADSRRSTARNTSCRETEGDLATKGGGDV